MSREIKTCQVGMAGLDARIPVVGHFDFDLLKGEGEEVQLVDVGGGYGIFLKKILDENPGLDRRSVCCRKDQTDVIEMARRSQALLDVVLMLHDFLTEQPVKGWSFIWEEKH